MTEPRRILVLGDSSMASFGCCHDTAIDHFAARKYHVPVHVENGSFAGMTAADAYVHASRALRSQAPHAIVLCVGNCDASAYGMPKPFAHNPIQSWWLQRREGSRRRHSLYGRNPPGEFVAHDIRDVRLRRTVTPEDHARYLDAVARRCQARGVALVVIVPVAKSDFPPCNNIGNVALYRILNVPDDHAYHVPPNAALLTAALAAEASRDVSAARRAYEDLARAGANGELGDIARNNLACLDAVHGPAGARDAFMAAIRTGSPLRPVALFNAAISGAFAESGVDESMLRRALDEDAGSYRITSAYRTAALTALGRHGAENVRVIDAAAILGDSDFVDYAHPTVAAHRRIFHALVAVVDALLALAPGDHACSVRAVSMNPDASTGAAEGVFEHLHLVREPNVEFVTATCAAAAHGVAADSSARARAIGRICAHPLFGDADVLAACPPSAPTDQGGLSELFFLRHMRGLYERDSASDSEAALRTDLAPIRPDAARMDRWWPLTDAPFADPDALVRAIEAGRLLARCRARFAGIIDAGPAAAHKYRSMPYWFLRESLVFGSPSDVTGYLDRLAMLDVLDGCTAGLRAAAPGSTTRRDFEDLLGRLAQLLRLHSDHVGPYGERLFLMGRERLAAYRHACDRLLH